jgi:hypothetical protein
MVLCTIGSHTCTWVIELWVCRILSLYVEFIHHVKSSGIYLISAELQPKFVQDHMLQYLEEEEGFNIQSLIMNT